VVDLIVDFHEFSLIFKFRIRNRYINWFIDFGFFIFNNRLFIYENDRFLYLNFC